MVVKTGVEMDITYSSKKLENSMTKKINSSYEKSMARRIRQRLSEFSVSDCLADIPVSPPPRLHRLKGKYKNCFSVDISANYRLIIQAFDIENRQTINQVEAVSVQIMKVEDYHEK